MYFLSYLISPRYAHKMVGYLEEEAVRTYTRILADIDSGKLPEWKTQVVPEVAKKYWKLPVRTPLSDLGMYGACVGDCNDPRFDSQCSGR